MYVYSSPIGTPICSLTFTIWLWMVHRLALSWRILCGHIMGRNCHGIIIALIWRMKKKYVNHANMMKIRNIFKRPMVGMIGVKYLNQIKMTHISWRQNSANFIFPLMRKIWRKQSNDCMHPEASLPLPQRFRPCMSFLAKTIL